MELRTFIDERAMPQVVDDRTIEGYAVVFERESRIMFDKQYKRFFVEVIKRGAVGQNDLAAWDIKAVMEHDKSRLLARSFNGAGTLTLSVDEYGVKYRFDAPNTVEGDNAVEMIRRRDIFGSSFAYVADEQKNVRYVKKDDGLLLREVVRIDRMFDVSPVSDPAFFGTDVNVRSLDQFFEPAENEEYLREVQELRSLITK